MGMSDKIESFIIELLKTEDTDGWIKLKRNELASVFGCVPSQINYVISTRFNAEHGYLVESRRGGGGYLKIRRIDTGENNPIYSVIQAVDESLDYQSARRYLSELERAGAIDASVAGVILAAVSDTAIAVEQPHRDRLRARIFKNAIAALI